MGKPVVHFEVMAKDAGRAQEFYGSLFSWNINANNPMKYGLVNTGLKKGINGGIGQVDRNSRPYTTFYVEVENPQSYLDRAVSLGGRVVIPVTEIPNMVTFAQFADPEGNVVGLVKSAQTRLPKPASRKKTRKRRARRD